MRKDGKLGWQPPKKIIKNTQHSKESIETDNKQKSSVPPKGGASLKPPQKE